MYTPAMERFALEEEAAHAGGFAAGAAGVCAGGFHARYAGSHRADGAIGIHGGFGAVERYNCLFVGKNAWKLKEERDVRYQLNAGSVIEGRGLLRDAFIRSGCGRG